MESDGCMMLTNWYIYVNGQTYGPYDWQQMLDMRRTGHILAETLVYHEQVGEWGDAQSIQEFGFATSLQSKIQKNRKKRPVLLSFIIIGILIVGFAIIPSLRQNNSIELTREKRILKEGVTQNGGTLIVDDMESALHGLEIIVPSGAYDKDLVFEISTKEVKDHEFGDVFNPILPVIHVDNGGDMASEFMTMKIPISITEDEFAMACYYNADGTLEPIPMISLSNDEMVLGLSHFSDIVITSLRKALLEEYINEPVHDSGYRPGVDNWSFTNYGSAVSDGGMCAGMTLSSIYYYKNHTKNGEVPLHSYMDNNHYLSTPDWWKDDSMGIRLTSVVQEECNWDGYDDWTAKYAHQTELLSDKTIFYHFAYTFLLSDGDPQGVSLFVRSLKDNKPQITAGHAIVAYAMDSTGIYVCDPNYPDATNLKIPFDGENFGIYDTASVADGPSRLYNSFSVLGTSSLYSTEKMEGLFKELKKDFYESAIGDDLFPNPKFKALILEEDEISEVENVELIQMSPEDNAKYKRKIQEYMIRKNWVQLWNNRPDDWESKQYLISIMAPGTDHARLEIYLNNHETAIYDKLIPQAGTLTYIPIENGRTNIGLYFSKEFTYTVNNQTWKSYRAIDYYRTDVLFGEIDLTGAWEGEFQIQDVEKAMDFAEKIGLQISRLIVKGLAGIFGQELTDEEVDEIARESIEVNDELTDPMPIKLILSNRQRQVYDALIEVETDELYEYNVKAELFGDKLEFAITHEDGTVMVFKYYVYNNELLSGEFEMRYAGIANFLSGSTELTKQ
jgi:hypothetical protein